MTETAWLIEQDSPARGSVWFSAVGPEWRFVNNANEALRFARKTDAETFIKWLGGNPLLSNPRATEHQWIDAARAEGRRSPGEAVHTGQLRDELVSSSGSGRDEAALPEAVAWLVTNPLLGDRLLKSEGHARSVAAHGGGKVQPLYAAPPPPPVAELPGDVVRLVIDAIGAERRRQIESEGWSPKHDDAYVDCELARAALTYAMSAATTVEPAVILGKGWWPWANEWFKPSTPRRDLIRAGALIVAEIERIDRATQAASKEKWTACGEPGDCEECGRYAPELLMGACGECSAKILDRALANNAQAGEADED